MNHHASLAVRVTVILLLLGFFAVSIYISFIHLLQPKDSLNSKTLYEISNPYQEQSMKGNICDRNGVLLMGSASVAQDGSYILVSGQEQTDSQRVLLETEHPECWSNLLPAMFSGLDSEFSDILQDIPLNEENTDILLTIDSRVQADVYEIMKKRSVSSAVIMKCGSADGTECGDILAMVSRPSYRYNTFRNGKIPYTSYTEGGQFFNNVDNAHDCVQDYYKEWKKSYLTDNQKQGESVSKWIHELEEKRLLFTETEALYQIRFWNSAFHSHFSLADCISVSFPQIFSEEQNFYQNHAETERFPFAYEPSAIGKGQKYTPFAKLILPDGSEKYLKLCYGNNNFILNDCKTYGFDPNFSFQNSARSNSQPGSCFKMLFGALLLDELPNMIITENDVPTVQVITDCAVSGLPLPTAEESPLKTLRSALVESSNYYFAMSAMELSEILKSDAESYTCTFDSINQLNEKQTCASGAFLLDYYQKKFCLNVLPKSCFFIPKPSIFGALDTVQVLEKPEDTSSIYEYDRGGLWYTLDKDGNTDQAYMETLPLLKKAVGDTAYGQGYDLISPVFMASALGKCITGQMYLPNLISDSSQESQIIGEPFDRGTQTAEYLSANLKNVYDEHDKTDIYVPKNLSFSDKNAFTYYAKTGTASFDRSTGTQSTYGTFAELAGYPIQPDDSSKYQIIWYAGAVSDGTDCYAVILRSFFDKDSYSLKNEFLQIVDDLYRYGYLHLKNQ